MENADSFLAVGPMAFLAEDEDAMRAFEAALSFVDGFSGDENTPEFTALNKTAEALSPVANGLELPSNAAADHESDAHSAGPVATVNSVVDATIQGPRYTSAVPNISRASGTAARPVSEVVKARHRAADNARKRMLRKAGVYACSQRTEARDCIFTREGRAVGDGAA